MHPTHVYPSLPYQPRPTPTLTLVITRSRRVFPRIRRVHTELRNQHQALLGEAQGIDDLRIATGRDGSQINPWNLQQLSVSGFYQREFPSKTEQI